MLTRRGFLRLLGTAAPVAAVAPTYFFAPRAGWVLPTRHYTYLLPDDVIGYGVATDEEVMAAAQSIFMSREMLVNLRMQLDLARWSRIEPLSTFKPVRFAPDSGIVLPHL